MGNGKGVVKHIVNDQGASTQSSGSGGAVPAWLCSSLEEMVTLGNGTCAVGSSVSCPGSSVQCAGNECCGDGSTCPSAQEDFQCCPLPKTEDCVVGVPTPPPTPLPTMASPTPPTSAPTMGPCLVGDSVYCP